jgi:chromosome segregation protein
MHRDEAAADYLYAKRDLARLAPRYSTISERLARVELMRSAGDASMQLQKAELQDITRRARDLDARLSDLAAVHERATRRAAHLHAERVELAHALEGAHSAVETAEEALARARRDEARAREIQERVKLTWQDAHDRARLAQEASHEAANRRALTVRRLEDVESRLRTAMDLQVALRRDLERRSAEDNELVARAAVLNQEMDRVTSELSARAPALSEAEKEVRVRTETLTELRALEERERQELPDLAALRDRHETRIGEHERMVAEAAALRAERNTLLDEIATEFEPGIEALPALPALPPTVEEIKRLRSRANQYSEADPSVVEEARALGERQQYLRVHLDDLEHALTGLREMMEIADREMRERFARAYQGVSEEFTRVFRVMLRGGDAHLEMVGEDGGIEIQAQLPGRRVRSSAAFSGGERALVASALLFGVLHIRPAPFCVLDEVDAALDEGNVDRYLTVLRDISTRTQILVVTHNRATMAAADVLYGLTMDDAGVSRVLSMRLDAYATG